MKYSTTHIQYSIFIALLLCLAIPADALAQLTDTTGTATGERGAPHVYKYDTRSVALGEATVAEPRRLSSININPAALSFVSDFNVVEVTAFQNWNNNLSFANVTMPVISAGNNRVAAQLGYYTGGFDLTNPLGSNPQPEPSINMYQVDVAYAYSYENVLSLGVFNSTTFTQSEDARYWTNFSTVGLLYAPTRTLSYGLAFRGIGRSVVYRLTGSGNTVLESQNLRESLELGATVQFPVDTDDPQVSLSFANEKRFGENGIWYKMGLEAITLSNIAFRGGFLLHPENNIFAPRFGLGFKTDAFQLDYSVSFQDKMYERFHQIGITFNLD